MNTLLDKNESNVPPKRYIDQDGFQILPGYLYALYGDCGCEYFIPVSRPSRIKPFWYFFRLNGTNKPFDPESTKKLKFVENIEIVRTDLTQRLESLKKVKIPSKKEVQKRTSSR